MLVQITTKHSTPGRSRWSGAVDGLLRVTGGHQVGGTWPDLCLWPSECTPFPPTQSSVHYSWMCGNVTDVLKSRSQWKHERTTGHLNAHENWPDDSTDNMYRTTGSPFCRFIREVRSVETPPAMNVLCWKPLVFNVGCCACEKHARSGNGANDIVVFIRCATNMKSCGILSHDILTPTVAWQSMKWAPTAHSRGHCKNRFWAIPNTVHGLWQFSVHQLTRPRHFRAEPNACITTVIPRCISLKKTQTRSFSCKCVVMVPYNTRKWRTVHAELSKMLKTFRFLHILWRFEGSNFCNFFLHQSWWLLGAH